MEPMDLEALARRSGVPVDRVRRMVDHAIVEGGPDGFPSAAIARVRMVDALEGAGVDVRDLAAMIRAGEYSMTWVDAVSGEQVSVSETTLTQAAGDLDLPIELIRRLYQVSWMLPVPADDERLREDDLELLRIAGAVFALTGRDPDRTVEAGRTFGDNLRRLSETQTRLFREGWEEPLLASGLPHVEVMAATVQLAEKMIPMGFRAIELLYRRHFEHFALEDVVTNIEIAMERSGRVPARTASLPAIVFLDLTGFTSFSERAGDEAAGRLVSRFVEMMLLGADRFGGTLIKTLGDGAMFRFSDPAQAVAAGLELVEDVPAAGLPPAHVGINVGPAIFRDGDYFGRAVNLAARVADRAAPGEVLVTTQVVRSVPEGRFEFLDAGSAYLHGIAGSVDLWRALPGLPRDEGPG
jgi:adenylate cyclase